ncbi:MAG: hypothetical protein JO357_03500 [Hyphomicrobiales bacterium]|nr:hypothetical protein [Hyphomicrobiales bacterium]
MRAAGISWRDYDRFMQKYVKKMGDERLTKVPADLDLKPYRDEHDVELLERMATAVTKGRHPPGINKAELHAKIKAHIKDRIAHAHAHMPKEPATISARRKPAAKRTPRRAAAAGR